MSPNEKDDLEPATEPGPEQEPAAEPTAQKAGPKAAPKAAPKEQTTPPTQETAKENLASATLNFHGDVYAQGGAFGAVDGADTPKRKAATGKLTEANVADALEHYVPPESYDDAAEALARDHVVTLFGRVGIGKRASAVALLREVTDGQLAVLSPTATLDGLAERPYNKGYGYVAGDRFDEDLSQEITDFTWRTVRDQVADEEAFLVVTTTSPPRGSAPESVRHFAWERPSAEAILRAHLAGVVTNDAISEAIDKVPTECALADAVQIANRIAQGKSVDKAVQEVLNLAGNRHVRDWFAQRRTRREILEVTATAFLAGVDERTFEAGLERLEKALAIYMPPAAVLVPATASAPATEAQPSQPAEEFLPERRGRRVTDHSLLSIDQTARDGLPRRIVSFKEDGYRRQILTELWNRYDGSFWDAVYSWLDELVENSVPQLCVAVGLALLSYVAFNEVERSYLERWSDGYLGWPGQVTAVYVLWCMCLDKDETLATAALRTATRWISYGSAVQRWTGAVAFTGELGVRYPTDAVRRLSQLVAQDNNLSEPAAVGLGWLFATLTDSGEDAAVVARHLETQLTNSRPHGKTRRRRTLALTAVISLLSVRVAGAGNPAVTVFLHGNPDRMPLVARLWAAALRHRPCRHLALTALWDALSALERISPDPEQDARALGEALAGALLADEQVRLRTDFLTIVEHTRRQRPNSTSLTQILLEALERARPQKATPQVPEE